MSKRLLIMPIYNEWGVFESVLEKSIDVVKEHGVAILVIDDGSVRSNFSHVKEGSSFLRHQVNCGVGAAIGTGLQYARQIGAEFVVTMDGDGQHDARDVLKIFEELEKEEVEIVNGSRFLKQQSIPWSRRLANGCGNLMNFLLSGFWVTDSQSGMKGFSVVALRELHDFSAGYEWCLDVFRIANWKGLKVRELPISVTYSEYSLRKGQGIAVGLDMVMRLMVRTLMKG